MAGLASDIAAFDRMKGELETSHLHEWALFYRGKFVGVFPDFEAAATVAVDRYDEPYLIRQVGAGAVRMPGGMLFRPAHALNTSGL